MTQDDYSIKLCKGDKHGQTLPYSVVNALVEEGGKCFGMQMNSL